MHSAVFSVHEFHKAMGQSIGDPRNPDISIDQAFRMRLITEEVGELALALEARNKKGEILTPEQQIIEVADALGDISYVIAGSAVAWGIDLGGVFEEIHRSNMTKDPGKKRGEKAIKGANYSPPDIAGVLKEAAEETEAHGTGEDSWWPLAPSVATVSVATKQAMSEINKGANFVDCECPHGDMSEPDHDSTCPGHLPGELASKLLAREPSANAYGGYFTHGSFIFECPCSRLHTVPTQLGSRGGWAGAGECECICGRHFTFEFQMAKGKDPIAVCTKEQDLSKVAK